MLSFLISSKSTFQQLRLPHGLTVVLSSSVKSSMVTMLFVKLNIQQQMQWTAPSNPLLLLIVGLFMLNWLVNNVPVFKPLVFWDLHLFIGLFRCKRRSYVETCTSSRWIVVIINFRRIHQSDHSQSLFQTKQKHSKNIDVVPLTSSTVCYPL